MSKRETLLLLLDIQDSIIKIKKYLINFTFEDFINDDKTLDAVVRNFEIIGEASSKIDLEYKNENKHINWKDLKNFRSRMIHDYAGIDYEIVWDVITNYLDELESKITLLINEKI